ncbi:MAG TPA: response regulator, partial [Pseudomonadales bacterium]|nr:response regulator [Pseudomonadales bacterium]
DSGTLAPVEADLVLIDFSVPCPLERVANYAPHSKKIALTGSSEKGVKENLNSNALEMQVRPISSYELKSILQVAFGAAHRQLERSDEARLTTGWQNKHILIAEDNEVNQIVVNGILRKLSLQFTNVSNGVQAVQCYQENPGKFDLILMDCEMPEMDGFSATQMIRRWESERGVAAVPIIALTAHAVEEYKQRALEAGMNSHIAKPIQMKVLQATLASYLSGAAASA